MTNGMCGIRPPFQGSDLCDVQSQGVALGCDRTSLWDSRSALIQELLTRPLIKPSGSIDSRSAMMQELLSGRTRLLKRQG